MFSLFPVSVLWPVLDTQWALWLLGFILGGDYRGAKERTKQDLLLSLKRRTLGEGNLGHLNHMCVLPSLSSNSVLIRQGETLVWSTLREKGEKSDKGRPQLLSFSRTPVGVSSSSSFPHVSLTSCRGG